MLPRIACSTGVKFVLPLTVLIGLHLTAYHEFFTSQVFSPSVWSIPSITVLANLNKGSPPHHPTNHFPIVLQREPLVRILFQISHLSALKEQTSVNFR